MLSRSAVAASLFSFLSLVSLALAGCSPAVAPDALATVGGRQITTAYVQSLVPLAGQRSVLVGGEPHPIEAAVNLAVRDELLTAEADRRGIRGDTRAARLAGLVTEVKDDDPTLSADGIADVDARRWYAEHRNLFDEVEAARVSWATFNEEGAARAAFARGINEPDSRPGMLAQPAAISRAAVASIRHDGGADEMVLRITNAVRRPGGLGLDQHPETGVWYLARVEAVTLEPSPWDPVLARKVKSALAWEREQTTLNALADTMRSRSPVTIFHDRVAALID